MQDGLWTPREHGLFMDVVEAHAGTEIKVRFPPTRISFPSQWSAVVEKVSGRSEQQCEDYMQRLVDRGLINVSPYHAHFHFLIFLNSV